MPEITNIDDADIAAVKVKVASETRILCGDMEEQMNDCWTMQEATTAKSLKINHMDGFHMSKKLQQKDKAPNTHVKRRATFMRQCGYWGEICFDGYEYQQLPADTSSKVSQMIGRNYARLVDQEGMLSLCAPLLCGTDCSQHAVNLDLTRNFIADDGLGLTPEKIIKAKQMLAGMNPGCSEDAILALNGMQITDLAGFDQFTNTDYLIGESVYSGMFPKAWFGVRFKKINDYKTFKPGSDCENEFHATTKIDINYYTIKEGLAEQGWHRRWLPMFYKSSVYKTQLQGVSIYTRDLHKTEGLWPGSFAMGATAIFGHGRADNDGVVWMPVREYNPLLLNN